MKTDEFLKKRVSRYYWKDGINCATTTLKILSEAFEVDLDEQVVDAALGMHGAGEYGAQCGLVEGTLMFLGIYGRGNSIPDNVIVQFCREFANQFENEFGSLQCSVLRPEGFHPDNAPHICEPLTCRAVEFSIRYITGLGEGSKQEVLISSG